LWRKPQKGEEERKKREKEKAVQAFCKCPWRPGVKGGKEGKEREPAKNEFCSQAVEKGKGKKGKGGREEENERIKDVAEDHEKF